MNSQKSHLNFRINVQKNFCFSSLLLYAYSFIKGIRSGISFLFFLFGSSLLRSNFARASAVFWYFFWLKFWCLFGVYFGKMRGNERTWKSGDTSNKTRRYAVLEHNRKWQKTYILTLVRKRSPVRIWLAAPIFFLCNPRKHAVYAGFSLLFVSESRKKEICLFPSKIA